MAAEREIKAIWEDERPLTNAEIGEAREKMPTLKPMQRVPRQQVQQMFDEYIWEETPRNRALFVRWVLRAAEEPWEHVIGGMYAFLVVSSTHSLCVAGGRTRINFMAIDMFIAMLTRMQQ